MVVAFRAVLVLLALSAADVSAVFAQRAADKPPRPILFGGSDLQFGARPRSLELRLAVSGAHDQDLSASLGQRGSPLSPRVGGEYADFEPSLSFVRTRRRLRVALRAASSVRRYMALDTLVGSSHFANADFSANLDRKTIVQTTVDFGHLSNFAFDAVARRPLDQRSLSPTEVVATSFDWVTNSYGGSVGLTRTLGRQTSIVLSTSLRRNERSVLGEQETERTAVSRFARELGPDTSLRVSYAFRHATIHRDGGTPPPDSSHDVQLGVEKVWRHSATGRTVMSLAAGPSLVQLAAGTPSGRTGPVRLVGSVGLGHHINGLWSVLLVYHRGSTLRDTLAYSHTATLDVRGHIGRRADLVLTGGYYRGGVAQTLEARYGTSFGSARLQWALTGHLAAYVQYSADHYHFSGNGMLLDTVSSSPLSRHGVRAGVTVWVPLQRR